MIDMRTSKILPPTGEYPLPVERKKEMFGHPKGRPYYTKKEVFGTRNALAMPLADRYGSREEGKLVGMATDEINDSWAGGGVDEAVRKTLARSLDKLRRDLMRRPKRRDGSWAIIHPLEVALHLNDVHADADTLIGGEDHDHLEDMPDMGPDRLIRELRAGNDARELEISNRLAQCAVWHAIQLTDIPLPEAERKKITVPSDWRRPEVLAYLEKKHANRTNYINRLNASKLPDERLIKMFDTYSNVASLIDKDPKAYLDLMFNTVWKANMHIDYDKKMDIVVPYLTLRAEEQVNGRIVAAFPDSVNEFYARTNIPIRDMIATEFPYAIFANTSYHMHSKSFDQRGYETGGSIRTSLRKRLNPAFLKEQPYADTQMSVVLSESIKGCHKIGFNPIEIQMPRYIPKHRNRPASPLDESAYDELDQSKVLRRLQNDLDVSGFRFDVIPTGSLLPGVLGMDFLIYRLDFKDKNLSLDDYFGGRTRRPNDYLFAQLEREKEYVRLIEKLKNLLRKYLTDRKRLHQLLVPEQA